MTDNEEIKKEVEETEEKEEKKKSSKPPALQAMIDIKKVFTALRAKFFLLAMTAVNFGIEQAQTLKVLHLGMTSEDFLKHGVDIIKRLGEERYHIEPIKAPYNFTRGLDIFDNETGIRIVVVAYFPDGEMRFCPFTKGEKSLAFSNELLEKPKSIRISGNLYVKVPAPVEDYMKSCFVDPDKGNFKLNKSDIYKIIKIEAEKE